MVLFICLLYFFLIELTITAQAELPPQTDDEFNAFVKQKNETISVVDMVRYLELENIIMAIPSNGSDLTNLEKVLFQKPSCEEQVLPQSSPVQKRSLRESLSEDSAKLKVLATMKNMGSKTEGKQFKDRKLLQQYYKQFRKDLFENLIEKLRIEINNAKGILKSTQGLSYVIFMKKALETLWNSLDEKKKRDGLKSAVPIKMGDEGDISTDKDINETIDSLKDDDELQRELDPKKDLSDKMKVAKEVQKLDAADRTVLMHGKGKAEVKLFDKLTGNSKCECKEVDGSDVSGNSDDDDDMDIDLKDFDGDTKEEDPLKLEDLEDMGGEKEVEKDSDYEDEFIESLVKKRGISKRCPCMSINKRDAKDTLDLPPLTSALRNGINKLLLDKAKVSCNGKICDELRLGAVGAIAAFKLLCPKCVVKIDKVVLDAKNKYRHGWEVLFDSSETMDVFILETLKSYNGNAGFYDGNENRFLVEKLSNPDRFRWRLTAHL